MHKKWLNMLPDYITNSLPDEQKRGLEKHLKTCADCREALEDWRIIADVTRMKAESLKSPLPPLLDVLDGTNHSKSQSTNATTIKEAIDMTTLRIRQQKSYNFPWTAAAVLLLTFFFSLLLLGGLDLQPVPLPLQQGQGIGDIPEDPIELFQLYLDEVWNKQNLEAIPQLLSENHIHHDASMSEDIVGFEAMTEYVAFEHNILPDVTFTTQGLVANGDTISGRVTMSYEEFETTVLVSATIADGKLLETWFDVGTMLEAYNVDLISRDFAMLYSGETLTAADFEPFEHAFITLHLPNGTWVGNNHDRASAAEFWNMNHASCSNWQGEREFMSQDDLVIIQSIGTCTFEAPFSYWGAVLQPTGTEIQNHFTWVMRVEEGKVAEVWMYQNDPRFYATVINLINNGVMASYPDLEQINTIYQANSEVAQERAIEALIHAFVDRYVDELWNVDEFDTTIFKDAYRTTFNAKEQAEREELIELYRAIHTAFPDDHMTVTDVMIGETRVAIHFLWKGTHTETFEYQNILLPPTNEEISTVGVIVFDYGVGGIIKETWYADFPFLADFEQIADE